LVVLDVVLLPGVADRAVVVVVLVIAPGVPTFLEAVVVVVLGATDPAEDGRVVLEAESATV